MIKDEAWQELVAALALRAARIALRNVVFDMPVTVIVPYEEIEAAPAMRITWDPEREQVEILVVP